MSAQEEPQTKDPVQEPPASPAASASDKETDFFEDAVDTTSIRSLTGRKLSGLPATRPLSGDTDGPSDPPASPEPPEDPVQHPKQQDEEGDGDTVKGESEDGIPPSPDRLSKRVSTPSLDNIDLDDEAVEPKETNKLPEEEPPAVPEKDPVPEPVPEPVKEPVPEPVAEPVKEPVKEPKKKLSLSNFASSLPSMPWSPSPEPAPTKTSPPPTSNPAATPGQQGPPPAASRKFASPFSWMSRNSTQKDPSTSSPPTTGTNSPRRNTASSIATLTSNPEMMLSKLDEVSEVSSTNGGPRPVRNSLRDRFKIVRMREEAGIALADNEDETSHTAVVNAAPRPATLGVASPTTDLNYEGQPMSPMPLSPNPTLAPGTVSGIEAGPSAMIDGQVDWDLWQSVVYEGPAAVARTSAEELNRAIATGIPNVIRGVVWQVCAQSKNEELEMVYKQLVARGNEKSNRNSNGTSLSSSSNGNSSSDKEPLASSASSVHSEQSGASGAKSSPSVEAAEPALKIQVLSAAERKKKEREDAAALQRLEKAIRRDMGARTSFSKHAAAAGLQEGLFGVCKAYALFDEDVGYAQGMNFLIMPLLFNMPEEEAFCILVRLMNHYKLRDLFIQDMPGLHKSLYQFERLLEDLEPALYCHLHRRGVSPHLYATQWFLTLFAYRFPLQLVLRIYDLIFSEGLEAILRFGVVLMQKNAATLLKMTDMGQLTTFLKDKVFDVYIDQAPSAGSILENGFFGSSSSSIDKEVYRADQLVRDACEVKLTPELLKLYTTEWEEKTRAEKEREEELQKLKTTNLSNAIRIRKLEERLEASDRESATMATDLVQTKVENEELKDHNESLVGQVRELRNVIEKQPEELEAAWQIEREDLVKKHDTVQEENKRLEKELADLEEQLVQTKMRYAEVRRTGVMYCPNMYNFVLTICLPLDQLAPRSSPEEMGGPQAPYCLIFRERLASHLLANPAWFRQQALYENCLLGHRDTAQLAISP
ncbi:hypothetical protein SLS62_005719 [Diatrype stigma]|uniref:GTPase-activating protein GYP5 n=1 Tax=Diatrype stigma TaxID=117547 RepID=A0AAN9USN3_9PEZI